MNTETLLRHLKALDACDEAREWVATQPDAATAWAVCPRPDWLMWVLGELHVCGALTRQTLVLAACAAAETALPNVPAGEDRPRAAIETARRWARGEATVEEVRAAAYAADDASDVADLAARADADAAGAAADAADAAARAARAAARAARAAARADAIRSAVPWEVVEAALEQMETT